MQVQVESRSAHFFHRLLRPLVAATFADLALLLLVVLLHAAGATPLLLTVASFLTIALTLLAAASLVVGLLLAFYRFPAYKWPIVFVVVLTAAVFSEHAYVINSPPTDLCQTYVHGCILDEGAYYVPAAQLMLNGTRCGLQTSDGVPSQVPRCNLEHPFLGRAFIAAGIAIFGETDVGYRIFQVILGTLSIPLLFLLALKVSGNRRLSYFATLLFSFDVMFFTHSSAGLIDVHQVFFVLLAFVSYSYGIKLWKLDKYVVSGVFLGLAGLSKETAIFGALAFVSYIILFEKKSHRHRILSTVKVGVTVIAVFLLGLQLYDSLSTNITSIQNVQYILYYGSSLSGPLLCYPSDPVGGIAVGGYFCKFPDISTSAEPILPPDWLTYYVPVRYFVSAVCEGAINVVGTCLGTFYVSVGYYGITNLLVTWLVFIWVPLAALTLYRSARARRAEIGGNGKGFATTGRFSGDTRLAGLALLMFLWNYIPYFWIQYGLQRVTYPFYIIPAIPSLALGAGYLVTRPWFPRKLALVYLVAAFALFFIFFPDKSFLPTFLRALIDRQFLFQPVFPR